MEPRHLKKAGLKVTHPRKRILELLEKQRNKHLTADDIYRRLVEAGEEIGEENDRENHQEAGQEARAEDEPQETVDILTGS